MSDAIGGLGGGGEWWDQGLPGIQFAKLKKSGLETPYTANTANAISYGMSCFMTLFGGPLVNKLGIKWACVIAASAFFLDGSSYYVNSKYGIQWYLIVDAVVGGICGGFLYVAESTAMLSYPKPHERGKFLGIWVSMRNSGEVVGGIVSLCTNIEVLGLPVALSLTPTRDVRRKDGTGIPSSADQSWKKEFQALWKHLKNRRVQLMFIPAFYSFFYGGVFNTYLSLHFSTESRALSSFITPVGTIILVNIYGRIIDNKSLSQKTRAKLGLAMWAIPQAAVFIWVAIIYSKFSSGAWLSTGIDFKLNTDLWAKTYLPYWIMQMVGYTCQLYMYWILACFSTDVKASARTGGLFRCFETLGQAISYGINTHNGNKAIQLYINIGIFIVMLVPMTILIRMVPNVASDIDDVVDLEDHKGEARVVEAQTAFAHEHP
ncbi:hypothetical protein JCM24511_09994 [Saitozyma sp. JCM 24511]|nr:hypothetical protein JCM24511_09994 [Saitozyma sp. JCM 24511]